MRSRFTATAVSTLTNTKLLETLDGPEVISDFTHLPGRVGPSRGIGGVAVLLSAPESRKTRHKSKGNQSGRAPLVTQTFNTSYARVGGIHSSDKHVSDDSMAEPMC